MRGTVWLHRGAGVAFATLGLTLASAASASATTVDGELDRIIAFVSVADRSGENRVAVRVVDGGRAVIVHDRAERLQATGTCKIAGSDGHRAKCDATRRDRSPIFLGVAVETGGGEDRVVMEGRARYRQTFPFAFASTGGGADRFFGGGMSEEVYGGPGDDHAFLGRGSDTFGAVPGPDGDDVIDGGGGFDAIEYFNREEPVVVNLADETGGSQGEVDRFDDLRGAFGGNAADLLLGTAGSNVLIGGAGRDRIEAGNGGDFVDGDGGLDEVFAERGRDFVGSFDGRAETVDCGPHHDIVFPDPDDVLVSCEENAELAASPARELAVPDALARAARRSDLVPRRWERSLQLRASLAP